MKSDELAVGGSDFPDARAPVEDVRGISAGKDRVGGKVRVVKGDERRGNEVAAAMNVHIARIGMMNAEDASGIVKRIAWSIEVLPRQDLASTGGGNLRGGGRTQNLRGIGGGGGVADGAAAIGALRDG